MPHAPVFSPSVPHKAARSVWRAVLIVSLAAVICVGALVSAARSETLRGQDDSGFQTALTLWLDDDDASALPALAGLAAKGNRAAQVLLALIDLSPQLHGPWLANRSRSQRIALMRAPGGLSGRSWLEAAATDTPLAQLWLGHRTASIPSALSFADLGETRAVRETLQAIAARDQRGFAAYADDPRYPPEMRHLIWAEWTREPDGAARVASELDALLPGDPQVGYVRPPKAAATDLDAWLAQANIAAPLRSVCSNACPASGAACLRAAFVLVKGLSGLIAQGGPPEAIVPAEVWDASPRSRASVLRQAHARYAWSDRTAVTAFAHDPCLAAALATETARFDR